MKAKRHPEERPRGVRDPAKCMVQSGGRLVWIEDGQPMFWSDRPVKFPGHIRLRLRKRGGVVITDVKWRQLAGRAWWRLPDWPAGLAAADGLEEVVRGHTTGDKPVIIGPGREATERTVRDGYEGRSAEGAEVGRLALHRHRRRRARGGVMATIMIERSKVYPSRPRAGGQWYWLYEATGPDTIVVGARELPRRFDNRSIVELRRVLRRTYGQDVQIIELWKALPGRD